MFFTLSFGQNGGIIAFLLVAGFITQRKKLSRLSGFTASLLLIVPAFLPMFLVLYWVKRDFRALVTFLVFTAFWFYLTGWLAGFEVWVRYWLAQGDYIHHLSITESYAYLGSVLGLGLRADVGPLVLTIAQFAAVLIAANVYLSAETSKQYSLEFVAFLLGAKLMNPFAAHYNMAALTIAAIILMRLLPRAHRQVWRFVILFFWLSPVFAASIYTSSGVPIYFFALAALYCCLILVLRERARQTS